MNISFSKANRFALAVVASSFVVMAQAAPKSGNGGSAEQRYQQERAACMNGSSNQDRPACLKEATNALAEARRHPGSDGSPAEWRQNALARCAKVPATDKTACERLAMGEGKQSGSVEGGGIVKEIVTTTYGPPVVLVPVPR